MPVYRQYIVPGVKTKAASIRPNCEQAKKESPVDKKNTIHYNVFFIINFVKEFEIFQHIMFIRVTFPSQ